MIGRTSAGRFYQSESFDRGETWTTPNPTDLYSPEAPPNIERIPGTDDILLLWNSQSVFNRSGFNSPKLASFLIHKVYIKCLGACPEDLYYEFNFGAALDSRLDDYQRWR